MARQIRSTKSNPGMSNQELLARIQANDRAGFRGLRTLAYCDALRQRGEPVPPPGRKGGK